jgi:hypothetical protein
VRTKKGKGVVARLLAQAEYLLWLDVIWICLGVKKACKRVGSWLYDGIGRGGEGASAIKWGKDTHAGNRGALVVNVVLGILGVGQHAGAKYPMAPNPNGPCTTTTNINHASTNERVS